MTKISREFDPLVPEFPPNFDSTASSLFKILESESSGDFPTRMF